LPLHPSELELYPKVQQEKAKGSNKPDSSVAALSSASNTSGGGLDKCSRHPSSQNMLAPTALGKSLFGPDEPAIWKQVCCAWKAATARVWET
jgi:hypothetical protein